MSLRIMNLVFHLNTHRKVKEAVLFGKVIGEVEPPKQFLTLKMEDENLRYSLVDLVGIKTANGLYYVKGRVFTLIHKNWLEELEKIFAWKTGVILWNGAVRLDDKFDNFITMLNFRKSKAGNWLVSGPNLAILGGKYAERYPEFYKIIQESHKDGKLVFPVVLPSDYTEACEGIEFKLVNGEISDRSFSEALGGNSDGGGKENSVDRGNIGGKDLGVDENEDVSTGWGNGVSDLKVKGGLLAKIAGVVKREVKRKENDKKGLEDGIRYEIAPVSDNYNKIADAIKEAENRVGEIIDSLPRINDSEFSFDSELRLVAERLRRHWNRRMGEYTGKSLFKEALERVLPEYAVRGATGSSKIADAINVMGDQILDIWTANFYEEDENDGYGKFLKELNVMRVKVYLRMIELLLGIRDKLSGVFDVCVSEDVNMLDILKRNPYNLGIVDPRLSIEDLDKLAMLAKVTLDDRDILFSRNVAYMHAYMLNNNNPIIGDNTAVQYRILQRYVKSGIIVGKLVMDNIKLEGVAIKKDRIDTLKAFIDPEVEYDDFALPATGWKEELGKFFLAIDNDVDQMINDYIESGIGIKVNIKGVLWVSDIVLAKKELFIYNRLRELAENADNNREIEGIEKCVEEFEILKAKELGLPEGEFKLEERQAKAVHLVTNPVVCLTGPAGSGKTTTAEALVYAIEKVLGVNEDEIMFCAPTGKAANRLKEVVKRKTRTIHSLFGVGSESLSLRDPENVKKRDEIKVLIVDESSMPNVNLMYEMMLRVSDSARIFFLGDKEQLPPIGFGKPFASMLDFLPCVKLNVTKRASEKSGITRNANKVISETDRITDLEDTDDFRIIHEEDQMKVVDYVKRICRYHLGKGTSDGFIPVKTVGTDLNVDDIQVVTPLNKGVWGTVALNKSLQDIFNPLRSGEMYVSFNIGKDEVIHFRIGDRVIHTKKNMMDRKRLIYTGGNSFVKEDSTGICNGDVGKVIGIFKARDLDFSNETVSVKEELEGEFIRGTSDDTYYLGVQYRDVDVFSGEPLDFVILYRMESVVILGNEMSVVSNDLNNLDLAYALTVHKLQGSQAKLTVCVFLPIGNKFKNTFISRNMIYTAITRSQQGEYVIGDILGKESVVNLGRRVDQTKRRQSLMDLMV